MALRLVHEVTWLLLLLSGHQSAAAELQLAGDGELLLAFVVRQGEWLGLGLHEWRLRALLNLSIQLPRLRLPDPALIYGLSSSRCIGSELTVLLLVVPVIHLCVLLLLAEWLLLCPLLLLGSALDAVGSVLWSHASGLSDAIGLRVYETAGDGC